MNKKIEIITSGQYKYKDYIIRTVGATGGKAGKKHNYTSTLQVTKSDGGSGYFVKKQFQFIVGDKKSYDKAWEKCIDFIEKQG